MPLHPFKQRMENNTDGGIIDNKKVLDYMDRSLYSLSIAMDEGKNKIKEIKYNNMILQFDLRTLDKKEKKEFFSLICLIYKKYDFHL